MVHHEIILTDDFDTRGGSIAQTMQDVNISGLESFRMNWCIAYNETGAFFIPRAPTPENQKAWNMQRWVPRQLGMPSGRK